MPYGCLIPSRNGSNTYMRELHLRRDFRGHLRADMSYSSPKEKTTCILAICVKFCKLLMWSKKREKRGEKKGKRGRKREEGGGKGIK